MELTEKRILVTGGAGAIGKNLVEELINKGCEIIILDDLSSGHLYNIPKNKRVKFVRGSILDDVILNKIFKDKIDVIVHLAANFANQNSVDNPEKDLIVNGMGTLKMLQYAKMHKVSRFLYTSSSCVYGNRNGEVSEDYRDYKLDTPYAITKMLGERYVQFFKEMYGLNIVIVRYFNSFGPGEFPGLYRNVIPNFFKKAMNNEPLTIYGDGTETRDFNYVGNAVQGTILGLEKEQAIGEVFNIGIGEEISMLEVANKINRITGNKARIIFQERRNWDHVLRRKSNIDKIKKVLGYKPSISFDEGLKLKYKWLKEVRDAGLL